jgi:hypothetical protein
MLRKLIENENEFDSVEELFPNQLVGTVDDEERCCDDKDEQEERGKEL